MGRAFQQVLYWKRDVQAITNKRWWRWLSCWFSSSFWIITSYRLDRALYLMMGRYWSAIRILLGPFFFITRPWFGGNRCELNYHADIGPGLKILHPALGIVVSGKTIAGEKLTLTGGNCIGERGNSQQGQIRLGKEVSLGINAVVLGPVQIGDRVVIGAGAVVTKNASNGAVLIGVPAKPLNITRSADSQLGE